MYSKLYNLTLHNQAALAELVVGGLFSEVEVKPRLRPVDDPTDYNELKEVVREAVKDIPDGANVLVGGLGQFQALVTQLPFVIWFVNYNPKARRVEGVVLHEAWTRQELFAIENQ